MSGWLTNGVPLASTASGTLPLTGNERFSVDTQLASGTTPQTEALTTQMLSTLGGGTVQPLTDGATIALNASLGSYFSVTLGGNRTFSAFANPAPGQDLFLELTQDATGSRTVTWNANVSWAAGTAPTLTTTAGATDILEFVWNATGGKWRGSTYGKAFA